jgi:membrane protein implicated in regulation of membrane protease activity
MASIGGWWEGLTAVNQWFYGAAVFFGVIFLWQMISTLAGMGGTDHDVDAHVEPVGEHDGPQDAHDTAAAFKLLSLRSIIAFFTLFTWATAFYIKGQDLALALALGVAWGLAAALLISLLLYFFRRMTETGNVRIATCVGADGTVYLDIPENGRGEVRVLCSGILTHLKARASGGAALKAGTPVRIVRLLEPNTVEVAPEPKTTERKEQ